MPNAADDDEEAAESDPEDPMKALEASQAASKKQMEDEDALADLRQRNARMERSDRDAEEIIRARHAVRDQAEEERKRREQEEEDEEVKKFFYKVQAPGTFQGPPAVASSSKSKPPKPIVGAGSGLVGTAYGSDEDTSDAEEQDGQTTTADDAPATVTVKRRPVGTNASEPTVQELLAAKGITFPNISSTSNGGSSSTRPTPTATGPKLPVGIKRKGALGLGVKLVKKPKP